MQAGEVCGTVVCTVKDPALAGIPLLVVQRLEKGKKTDLVVAADVTGQAGLGDFIYMIGSKEASRITRKPLVPADLAIVGFIDQYNEKL